MTETSSKTSGQACPNCGAMNRVGVLLCDNCGYNLVDNVAAPSTRQFDRDAVTTDDPHATNVPGILKPEAAESEPKPSSDSAAAPAAEAAKEAVKEAVPEPPAEPASTASAAGGAASASTGSAPEAPAAAQPTSPAAAAADSEPAATAVGVTPPTPAPEKSPVQTNSLTPREPPPPLIVTEAQKKAVLSAGTEHFTESMVLKLEIEGYPTPLVITPKNEITLGRRDPATGTMPDIDLTAYSGYRLGVSRTHAIIRMKGDLLELLDLGSSNGTQLNGTRLTPHHPQIIRDGDLITLGKMVIRALFQLITPNPT